MKLSERLRDRLRDAGRDDRVVPPTGFPARLVALASGIMACLAVIALALGLAAGRLADRWGDELAHTSTIRISAPAEARAAALETVLEILESTPGVAFARALDDAEQRALLEPWLGAEFDWDILALPQLVEVLQADDGFDAASLRLRLAAEVPSAVFEDHGTWQRPLAEAAGRVNLLVLLCLVLLFAGLAAMVALAAHAVLVANAQVISVLRLVGATDRYIVTAFVRRVTLRAVAGAAVGVVAGLGLLLLLPLPSLAGPTLPTPAFRGWSWLLPLLVPLLAGAIALAATGWSARHVMKGLD